MQAGLRAGTLNERQRAYLLAIFAVDQELEAEMRSIPYRPFQQRPKASEWRWLEYSEPVPDINKPASRLYVQRGFSLRHGRAVGREPPA